VKCFFRDARARGFAKQVLSTSVVPLRQDPDDRGTANKLRGKRPGVERKLQAENSPGRSPSAGQWRDRADGQDP